MGEAEGAFQGGASRAISRSEDRVDPRDRRPSTLRLPNLLNDADTLADLLPAQVDAGEWLDAFLLAAGLDQILEDALHRVPFSLDRIANRLQREAGGLPGKGAAAAAATARSAVWTLRARQLSSSALALCQQRAASLAADLAELVIGDSAMASTDHRRALTERASQLKRELTRLPPRVRRTPLRLPSAFRNLDIRPEDVRGLMAEVMKRWSNTERPLLVVGVRTAGSYFSPLAAGSLRAAGCRVRGMTLRPGQSWLPKDRALLRWAATTEALVIVVDDPPNTWTTVAETAELLAHGGIKRSSIVPALQTFPTTSPPPRSLQDHPMVVLPWEQYHIQGRLDPEEVRDTLQGLLGGPGTVRGVRRLPFDPSHGTRAHVGALYEVKLGRERRVAERRLIYVQGVGLGYFGAHAVAISERLQSFLPRVYGLTGGLLFRDWLPEELRLRQAEPPDAVAEQIVNYVRARARAFPVAEDVSRRLKGRPSLWRGIGRFLSQPFGRAQLVCWPFLQAGARELLRVTTPSVVDARTGLSSWFRESPDTLRLRKIGFTDWAFSAYDTHCYDPIFDLAGSAASDESGTLDGPLRDLYALHTGEAVDAERWLLYQLVHLTGQEIESEVRDPETERRMSRRFQRYFGNLMLSDVQPASGGRLCAIDLDGVLESTPLGISATNLDGARCLRALHKHGYRPVIATGRSLAEVRERCVDYRAAGGVAEYGAAIYVTAKDAAHELLTADERRSLDSVRSTLEGAPGVVLDRSYQLAVRAYRLDQHGRRRALSEDQVQGTLAAATDRRIRSIQGQAQTDFMVQQVTKATGLKALAEQLGVRVTHRPPLVMAVGDTASDLPMLRLATYAFAPSNADEEVREAEITVLRKACQAGLAEATGRLLGHEPGRCPTCRDPKLAARSRLLLSVLSPPDHGSLTAKATWAAAVLARLTWHLGISHFGQRRGRGGAAERRSGARRGQRLPR
jgi:hydroxymethylpyrimidine pyrophosphatase-like HAD family hydrolase